MRAYLKQIPVRLMEHGQLGVIGAAGLYLDGQPMDGHLPTTGAPS
jgi:glucokinase